MFIVSAETVGMALYSVSFLHISKERWWELQSSLDYCTIIKKKKQQTTVLCFYTNSMRYSSALKHETDIFVVYFWKKNQNNVNTKPDVTISILATTQITGDKIAKYGMAYSVDSSSFHSSHTPNFKILFIRNLHLSSKQEWKQKLQSRLTLGRMVWNRTRKKYV